MASLLIISNIDRSAASEISIGIAVKENNYIADLKEILTTTYKELDKNVIWIKLPTSRSLRLTNSGKMDAEFLRVKSVAEQYENLIKISAPLIYTSINLYCKKQKDCESALIGKTAIGYNISYKIYERICEEKNLTCYGVNTEGDTSVLFEHNKFSVILSNDLEIASNLVGLEERLYRTLKLREITGHHYIHKKHMSLVKSLESIIEKKKDVVIQNSMQISELVKNNKMIEQLDF